MNGPEHPPVRQLEVRRGTEAVLELLADRRRIGVRDQGRTADETRHAARAERFRWQLDVAGP